MDQAKFTRRAFLAAATTTTVVAATAKANDAKVVPGKISPNEKINIAGIGAGGKGRTDIYACKAENIVALCDVDWDRGAEMAEMFDRAPRFTDYRNLLDKMGKEIDAVTITTPDHTHAPAAYMAMKMGIHCYVQKPLTHTVAEARLLTNTAKEMDVVTQMGNQGHSGNGVREMAEMLQAGAIGQVKEAHVWTHRPVWRNQGRDNPLPSKVQPENLDWDRWIGSAPWRPYNRGYAPHDWRAWQDFGGGALGDMACHIMDPVYMSLNLVDAKEYSVEVIFQEGVNSETFPTASTIKYSFPKRGNMDAVDVYWYDGHWPDPANPKERIYNRPDRPAGVPAADVMGDDNKNGSYLIGTDGIITAGEYGGRPRLLPDAKMAHYTKPDPTIPRVPEQNHYNDWLSAIHNGTKSGSDFSYAGPFTEMVNFGNLVVKSGKKLKWDNVKGKVTNVRNADEIVSKEYRKGWELPC